MNIPICKALIGAIFAFSCVLALAITPEEVLQKTLDNSRNYDFTSSEGSMFGYGVNYNDISNGSLTARAALSGMMFLAETKFTKSLPGRKANLIHNEEGDYIVVFDWNGKPGFAVKYAFDDWSCYQKFLSWRFEMLQTILEEWDKLTVKSFNEIKIEGKTFYNISLNFQQSQKCVQLLCNPLNPLRESGILETALLIESNDFFVHEQSYLKGDEEVINFSFNDLQCFPRGTISKEKFQIPKDIPCSTAYSHEEFLQLLHRQGLSQSQRTMKDIKICFYGLCESVWSFIWQNPKISGGIFALLGIGIISFAVIRIKRKS